MLVRRDAPDETILEGGVSIVNGARARGAFLVETIAVCSRFLAARDPPALHSLASALGTDAGQFALGFPAARIAQLVQEVDEVL